MILELSEKWDDNLAKADKELEKLIKHLEIGYFLDARYSTIPA
jgi:hypothetical protein